MDEKENIQETNLKNDNEVVDLNQEIVEVGDKKENIVSENKKSKKTPLIISLVSVFLAILVIATAVVTIFLNRPKNNELNVFAKGLVAVRTEDGWGYMNKKGELVIRAQFEEAYPFSENGVALVCLDGFYGFINTKGKYEVNPIYTEALPFEKNEDMTVVKRNGKYGYVEEDGEEEIICQFEEAYKFSNELALVKIGGKYGFIDDDGEFEINPQFDDADSFNANGLAVVGQRVNSEIKYGVINTKGKLLTNFEYKKVFVGNKYVIAFDGENYIFADLKMKELFRTTNEIANFMINSIDSFKNEDEGLIPFRDKNTYKYGYLNIKGEVVIESQFDIMGNFNDGLAKVKKEGKFGFIDKKGNFIVNNIYDFVGDFTNGYAIVAKGALYGLINAKGEVVMEIKYSYLGNVYNDVIGFKTTDKSTYGYYNVKTEEFLGPQQYNKIEDGSNIYNCSDDGYIVVKQGDYYGILNKEGEYVVNPYLLDICFINLV